MAGSPAVAAVDPQESHVAPIRLRQSCRPSANGKTGGRTPGIASQFRTQGMRDYYANIAAERVASKVVDCLTAVLADEEPKKNAAERKAAMEMRNRLQVTTK
jgi:hypothetical protein